jgi:Ribosomal protein L20
LKKANIDIDRKMLAEMALFDQAGFEAVAKQAQSALAKKIVFLLLNEIASQFRHI